MGVTERERKGMKWQRQENFSSFNGRYTPAARGFIPCAVQDEKWWELKRAVVETGWSLSTWETGTVHENLVERTPAETFWRRYIFKGGLRKNIKITKQSIRNQRMWWKRCFGVIEVELTHELLHCRYAVWTPEVKIVTISVFFLLHDEGCLVAWGEPRLCHSLHDSTFISAEILR